MWKQEGINGIACIYHVDGTHLAAPAHLSTWFKFSDSSTEIFLDEDEHIIAMDDGGLAAMRCYGFATNKGKTYKFGDPEGKLPDDVKNWKIRAKPGEVVGFAGHHNGRVQNLYFILQQDMESRTAVRESLDTPFLS